METKPPPFKKKWLFRRFVCPKILGIIASPSGLPWSIPKILFGRQVLSVRIQESAPEIECGLPRVHLFVRVDAWVGRFRGQTAQYRSSAYFLPTRVYETPLHVAMAVYLRCVPSPVEKHLLPA